MQLLNWDTDYKLCVSFIVSSLVLHVSASELRTDLRSVKHLHGHVIQLSLLVMFVCVCPDELQKRNEVIKVLTRRVWVVETREREVRTDLSAAQQQLCGLEQKQQQACQDYEVPWQHYQTVRLSVKVA